MKLLDHAIAHGNDELAALCLLVGFATALNGGDHAQTEPTPRRPAGQPQRLPPTKDTTHTHQQARLTQTTKNTPPPPPPPPAGGAPPPPPPAPPVAASA